MSQWWSWGLAVTALAVYWAVGNRWRWAWLAGIAQEAGWIVYGLRSGQPGFAVTAVLFAAVYARNWRRWKPGRVDTPADPG